MARRVWPRSTPSWLQCSEEPSGPLRGRGGVEAQCVEALLIGKWGGRVWRSTRRFGPESCVPRAARSPVVKLVERTLHRAARLSISIRALESDSGDAAASAQSQ
eukprot:7379217-Prymnesium_polylepis.1